MNINKFLSVTKEVGQKCYSRCCYIFSLICIIIWRYKGFKGYYKVVVTRLELVEHDVEGGVVEDEVDVVLSERRHVQKVRILSKIIQSSMLLYVDT